MKTLVIAASLASVFAASSALALEPIKGSITFGGQPASRLSISPVGSSFSHNFTDEFGHDVQETYVVGQNHDLKLVDRSINSTN